jgi:hypothetical protein
MPETPRSSRTIVPLDGPRWARRAPSEPDIVDRRPVLAKVIPRRAGVSWWLGVLLAVGLAAFVTPAITAERWLLQFHGATAAEQGTVREKHAAPFTVRTPMFAGYDNLKVGGGVVVARGEAVSRDEATIADAIADAMPRGPALYLALFALIFVLAAIFTHHMRRSTKGRLVRVQAVSLAVLAVLAVAVKIVMLSTALSALVVPVAVLAMVPTMVLDRIVGLATGVLAALVVSLLAPFDVGLAILLLVQAATAGLVMAERPKQRWLAALTAGAVTTLCTSATYLLLTYLTTGHAPELRDPLHSPWIAAALGPSLAAILAVPLIPIYQLLVGEITQGKLFALEDLGHPLLRQIAGRSPGTWQHSLMMANMAEIAANAVGASGRLVRVGAYFHDLGKSLSPKYFIENLEAGETSPHDQLPPEVSSDAIFAHVTEGIATARKAGLHERIVDFMHMHHGNGVLEYFWAKCREQGNPHGFTIEDFRYPGHPPQSRETAILTICDAVEAASRTLKKPDAAAIDSLVQRIVYGKLHLGQLDESGLSMSDLRRISDSLRETIRHANHGRIEYPWQKAGQDASASVMSYTSTSPRLDSLDRQPGRDTVGRASIPPPADGNEAFAATAEVMPPSGGPHARAASSVPITIPGRASGPLPPPPDLITPQTFDSEPPQAAGKHAATLPSAPPRRPPTPVDLDNAITNPPPMRRDPSGHPPVPSDPAQLAAALAATVSRASSGLLRMPHVDLDSASANPPPLGAPLPTAPTADVPGASANHASPDVPAWVSQVLADLPETSANHAVLEPALDTTDAVATAIVEPSTASTPVPTPARPTELDELIVSPPPAGARDGATTHRPASHPPQTSELTDVDEWPRAMAMLRGHDDADEPITIDWIPATPDAAPASRPGASTSSARPAGRLAVLQRDDEARVTAARVATKPRGDDQTRVTHEPRAAPDRDLDAGVAEPSLPILEGDERRVDLSLRAAPPPSAPPERKAGWANGLAARIDAALDFDEWSLETPVVAPTKAELRALLGQPDPMRQQPVDETALLQRRVAELHDADPPRRAPHPTTEVDPDDVEAAIELAPLVRRPANAHAIGMAKPKKSE